MKRKDIPTGELALIAKIRAGSGPGKKSSVVLGIGDDCAILKLPSGYEILVTTDFTLENRHFRRDLHPAESVGHRCLARGLSDLAAMGASPLGAFLSLALPPEMLNTSRGRSWVDGFFRGLRALGDRFGVPLAGGDTAESPNGLVLADITLIGAAPAGRALRRSGARPGDLLYVTGKLGGAAAELEAMFVQGRKPRIGSPAGHPQLFPEPRLLAGQALLKRGLATACLDLSDGLSSDLAHLCRASGVSAEVDEATLPIHPLAEKLGLYAALHGGEDYELLFAAKPSVKMPRSLGGIPITKIGRLRRGTGMVLVRKDGTREALIAGGWEHFATHQAIQQR